MSDTGKVLIGTDGSPLRGADGSIVVADVDYLIYPYRESDGGWGRYCQVVSTVSATVSPIWGIDWRNGWTQIAFRKLAISETHYRWSVSHTVERYKYRNTALIPWTRVASLKQDWKITGDPKYSGDNTGPVYFNYYFGTKNATLPSGSNEPWDGTGWTLIASVTPYGSAYGAVLASGTLDLPLDGGPFYIANFPTDYAGIVIGDDSLRTVVHQDATFSFTAFERLVYNLAT